MMPHFLFTALPVAALVAPAAYAVSYLSAEQAQQAIFPGKACTPAAVKLTPAQRKQIEQACGSRVAREDQQVWKVNGGGWFIVDEVTGKHEWITYAVGISAEGAVKGLEILDYRETYGGEIRNPKWRAQFIGKTSAAPLKLDVDIPNITGATLSSRHITDGIKRLLAMYELVLR